MRKGDVTVALLVAAALSCAAPAPLLPPAQPTASVDDEIETVVRLVDAHRKRVGCKPLEWSRAVAGVAQAHSADMVRRNFMDHRNPDGLTPFQRLAHAGINYSRAAENIAAGQGTGGEVFDSWIRSPGHRRNIEDCLFQEHGVGYTRGTPSLPYGTITAAWTHVFVRPR